MTVQRICAQQSEYPLLIQRPDGSVSCFYLQTSTDELFEARSKDHWRTWEATVVPNPDCAGSWKRALGMHGFYVSQEQGSSPAGAKLVGREYMVACLQSSADDSGRLASISRGSAEETDEWADWDLWSPVLPLQQACVCRTPAGRARAFYFKGDDPFDWHATRVLQAGDPVEGAGQFAAEETVAAGQPGKHPSFVHDPIGDWYYAVAWKPSDGTLRFARMVEAAGNWTLQTEAALVDHLQDGDTPGTGLEEQKVALYLDRAQRLRCCWWENDTVKAATVRPILPPEVP